MRFTKRSGKRQRSHWLVAGAVTAGAVLAVSTSPASAASANHWNPVDKDLRWQHSRDASNISWDRGAIGRLEIHWTGYKVGLSGAVQDNKRDGRGAIIQVKYDYSWGNGWHSTTRTFAHATGGYGSWDQPSDIVSVPKVANLVARFCTVDSSGRHGCSQYK